jgi:Tfp pilus assembly protein PilE
MVKAHEIARDNLQKNAQYQERYYDRSVKERKKTSSWSTGMVI